MLKVMITTALIVFSAGVAAERVLVVDGLIHQEPSDAYVRKVEMRGDLVVNHMGHIHGDNYGSYRLTVIANYDVTFKNAGIQSNGEVVSEYNAHVKGLDRPINHQGQIIVRNGRTVFRLNDDYFAEYECKAVSCGIPLRSLEGWNMNGNNVVVAYKP